jgi:hypothetical protein
VTESFQANRTAIRTRIRTTPQDTIFLIFDDDLTTTEQGAGIPVNLLNRVPHISQGLNRASRDAFFQCNATSSFAISDTESGAIQGCLRIKPIIQHGNDYLQVSLGLHKSAHNTK